MDMVFLHKERIFPGVHKIGAAISGPRIADTNFTDTKRISQGSRLSCPATGPLTPEGFSEGVSEVFLKDSRTCQPKDPSKPVQNAFKNPLKTFQEAAEIDDALDFPVLKSHFQGPRVL